MTQLIKIIYSDKLTKFSIKDKIRINHAIYTWIYGELDTPQEWRLIEHLAGWKILLWESGESKSSAFTNLVAADDTLNTGVPHGITFKNIKEVHCFINNKSSYAPFFGGMRQAFNTAISHEMDHMEIAELVELGAVRARTALRYQDKLARPGTIVNSEVAIVHDGIKEIELGIRKPRVLKIPGFSINSRAANIFLKFLNFQVSGLDIREYIDRL